MSERAALLRELQEAQARCAQTRRMLNAASEGSPDYKRHRRAVHSVARKRARAAERAWLSFVTWARMASPESHWLRGQRKWVG